MDEYTIPLKDGRALTTRRVNDHFIMRIDADCVATFPFDLDRSEVGVIIRDVLAARGLELLGT